ncbi:MAG TPA: lipopolysaccharide biosynthesis protein [Symbiobacteriaceae bacterium]
MKEGGSSLGRATLIALKWSYLGIVVKLVLQLGIQVVLARLLGPEPFGQIAVAWMIISLVGLLADAGFGPALVQRKELTCHDIRYGFTVQTTLGIVMSLAVTAGAGLLERFWSSPGLAPVIRAISLLFVLQALGQTATSVLKRQMAFKEIQVAQVISYVIAFCCLGIPAAFMGLGVWSLVLAQLTQGFLYTVLVYIRVKHSLFPTFRRPGSGLLQFGSKVVATNVFNWVIGNVDNFMVGRSFGVAILGLYSRSFNLAGLLVSNAVTGVQQVLFPAYALIQDRQEQQQRMYLASLNMSLLIMFPVFGGLAAAAHTVIAILYGTRWSGAAPILVPLALAMPFSIVVSLTGPLVWGVGRVEKEMYVQLFTAGLSILVLLWLSHISAVAVGWGVLAIYVLRAGLMTAVVVRITGLAWSDLERSYRGAVATFMAVTLVILGCERGLALAHLPMIARLATDVACGLAVSLGVLFGWPQWVLTEGVRNSIAHAVNRVPAPMRPLVRRLGAS